MGDPLHQVRHRTAFRLGGLLGFVGGFLLAYQNSSCMRHSTILHVHTLIGVHSAVLGMV